MSDHRVYKITSIGRPVEPKYPTNKAVLVILPLAGLLTFGFRYLVVGESSGGALLSVALVSMLVAFGSWALARELAPDDNPAAFISMGLAYVVCLLGFGGGLLMLFVALALTRILNRSTGLKPRTSDSVIVTLLVAWAAFEYDTPLIAAVAALAFILDTRLDAGENRQWPFAILCLSVFMILAFQFGLNFEMPELPKSANDYIVPFVLVAFMLAIFFVKSVNAPGDIDGVPLSLSRVKAGMLVALLLTLVLCFTKEDSVRQAPLLIATLAGIPVGLMLRNIRGVGA